MKTDVAEFAFAMSLAAPLINHRPLPETPAVWYSVEGTYEATIDLLRSKGIEIGEMPYQRALDAMWDLTVEWIVENCSGAEFQMIAVKRGKVEVAFMNPDDAFAYKMRFG